MDPENLAWERYREGWRAREARRQAEAEARRAAAQEAAERAIRVVAPHYPGIRRIYLIRLGSAARGVPPGFGHRCGSGGG